MKNQAAGISVNENGLGMIKGKSFLHQGAESMW